MCNPIDPAIEDALNKSVLEHLEANEMFTGYVITIRTRERDGLRLRHKDVRGNIHDLPAIKDAIEYGFSHNGETMEWDVCQVSIPGSTSGEAPFVYYREGQNPQDYKFLDNNGNQVAGTPVVHPTAQASITAVNTPSDADEETKALTKGGKNSDGTFSPDSYNRLWIPIQFVKGAGMSPGDKCHVLADPDQNMIFLVAETANVNTDGMTITTKTVEKHRGGVCLRTNQLTAAEINGKDKFVIESSDLQSHDAVKVTAS